MSGGALFVSTGHLAGTTTVNGGVLGGGGTIVDLTANSGGTVVPGFIGAIATLNATNATFNSGSTYEVQLNDGGFVAGSNNGLLSAADTVTINGGTVHVTSENGTDNGSTYAAGAYTIITAAGGVTGLFDGLTEDYAFLNFALAYDANAVFLNSQQVASFCLDGMTANQCATGNGVFALGNGGLFNAVLNLSARHRGRSIRSLVTCTPRSRRL